MIQNETITNILTRVTVRRFTDEPVSDEALHILLQAAMAAPSSMNFSLGISSWCVMRQSCKNSRIVCLMQR